MDTIIWLAAANAVVWFGLGGYLLFIGSRQKAIKKRLMRLELLKNDLEK